MVRFLVPRRIVRRAVHFHQHKLRRVVLLLNERAASDPESHAFSLSPRAGDTDTVIVSVEGTRAGEYFVRLQVDGAESLLDPDPASPAFGPRVTIP